MKMLLKYFKEIDSYMDKIINNINNSSDDCFLEIVLTSEKKESQRADKQYVLVESSMKYETIALNVINKIKSYKLTKNQTITINCKEEIKNFNPSLLIENFIINYFDFDLFKTEKPNNKFNIAFMADSSNVDKTQLKSVLMCRVLSQTPTNELNINLYVDLIGELFKDSDVKVEVLDTKTHNFSLLEAVGKASVEAPKMVILKKGKNPTKALVGKGIMYDTGGLSLKPSNAMDDMYKDMTGSAVTLCTTWALRHSKEEFYGILVLAENSIGSKSYRPGDIITTRSGKTVEIGNTDAEGRLALADGAHYATKELKCTDVICIGTLTGAVIVALGSEYAGLISNNSKLANNLLKSWQQNQEKLHQLPSDSEYETLLRKNTTRADFSNIGNREAGTITAWLFIKMLCAPKTNFAGIDIAGYKCKKYGVPSLVHFLKNN